MSQQYNEDSSKAKNRHQIKKFPLIQQWTPDRLLTPIEKAMCAGPENKGKMLKTCHYKNSENRDIAYRSELSSSSKSHSFSVSVEISPGATKIGSIKFFLSHSFIGKSYILAYMDWFGECERETESGIILATTTSTEMHNPFVLVSINL